MFLKARVLIFISLCYDIQGDDLDHVFKVNIPSYDEFSEWEPIPMFIFENGSTDKKSEDLSDSTIPPEENQEISKENEIENVFHMLKEIKERLEVINEPLKEIQEHLNERNEPLNQKKESLTEKNEDMEDYALPEVLQESLDNVVLLEVINEPLEDDGKGILERDCFIKDNIVKMEPENEMHFAGPVKAKGTVTVEANYGHEASHPINYPYPFYPPFFYGPFYYPLPYYFPYFPPSDPHDYYHEFYKDYFGTPSKHIPYLNREIEDCNREESEIGSDWPNHGKNEPKASQPFTGFVPASGRISIAAHF